MAVSASAPAVRRLVTKVPTASRVLEDTIVHNEARRTKKPVVPSTCEEALREATEEVASLPPPPIRVAAGSAQVRPRPRTHIIDTAASSGFWELRSRVAAAPVLTTASD